MITDSPDLWLISPDTMEEAKMLRSRRESKYNRKPPPADYLLAPVFQAAFMTKVLPPSRC